ncbi:MAG TPA: hypothetical protein VMN99_01670 [Anaerolineales bacterium]|nr:hypothetical protein [Anaerolineales bacterium]
MKTLIKLEELTLVVLSFYLFLTLDYARWWFPLLFLLGSLTRLPGLQLAGLVMFGHSSLDRALGFELHQTEASTK